MFFKAFLNQQADIQPFRILGFWEHEDLLRSRPAARPQDGRLQISSRKTRVQMGGRNSAKAADSALFPPLACRFTFLLSKRTQLWERSVWGKSHPHRCRDNSTTNLSERNDKMSNSSNKPPHSSHQGWRSGHIRQKAFVPGSHRSFIGNSRFVRKVDAVGDMQLPLDNLRKSLVRLHFNTAVVVSRPIVALVPI